MLQFQHAYRPPASWSATIDSMLDDLMNMVR